MARTLTQIQKQINRATGVNRRNVNTTTRRRRVRNVFRRKSSGGQGG